MSMTSLNARRAKADRAKKAAMITHSEWVSLGVLALDAAERACAANDERSEHHYVALARKCDAYAEQVWNADPPPHEPPPEPKSLSLVVRSFRTAAVANGFIVTLGLSREQLGTLRAMCDRLSETST